MAHAPIKQRPLQQVAESIHKGGLHESLGLPQGQKIPASRLSIKLRDGFIYCRLHPNPETRPK
jgi:hypothetical protein